MDATNTAAIDLHDNNSAITMNARRAAWALEAVRRFADLAGLNISPDADGIETAFGDLLGNMMHLADAYGLNFDDQAFRSRELFYEGEKQDEMEIGNLAITREQVEQAAALAVAELESTEPLFVRAWLPNWGAQEDGDGSRNPVPAYDSRDGTYYSLRFLAVRGDQQRLSDAALQQHVANAIELGMVESGDPDAADNFEAYMGTQGYTVLSQAGVNNGQIFVASIDGAKA